MNNCFCNLIENNWIWLLIIAVLIFCCGCN